MLSGHFFFFPFFFLFSFGTKISLLNYIIPLCFWPQFPFQQFKNAFCTRTHSVCTDSFFGWIFTSLLLLGWPKPIYEWHKRFQFRSIYDFTHNSATRNNVFCAMSIANRLIDSMELSSKFTLGYWNDHFCQSYKKTKKN